MMRQKQIVVKFKAAKSRKVNLLMTQIQKQYAPLQVERLFPDQDDAELSSLCVINIPPDEDTEQLLRKLRKDKKVEYAHLSAERKMAGGKR
jgi:hypothetical protein